MPAAGGAADKLGNRYEGLWAIDQVLEIIDGKHSYLTLEALDPAESLGVEFSVSTVEGETEYWSVKRQAPGRISGWTLAALTSSDERGRSILRDLFLHLDRKPSNRAVFASSLGAPDLEELRAHATTDLIFQARLARSRELKSAFLARVVPLCGNDAEKARMLLLRIRSHATDEQQLRDRVDFAIHKLLYTKNGMQIDCGAVRGIVAEFLLSNLHRPVTREMILHELSMHSFALRNWMTDQNVLNRTNEICDTYVSSLNSEFIKGEFLNLPGTEDLFTTVRTQHKVLVKGVAGAGKSSVLGNLVDRLHKTGVPVIPIRFDQLPDGILTSTELGRKLLLPESPALVLSGLAVGAPGVLIADQLDAISFASGRRIELWSVFDQLRKEIDRSPNLCLVVGCREFDLDNDFRMRSLKSGDSKFEIVSLGELSPEQVDDVLRASGTEPAALDPSLKQILTLPLHLSMFLRLPISNRPGVVNRDELFESFWTEMELRCDRRLGHKTQWTAVIDKLIDTLSSEQELSAPTYVLDDFRSDVAVMASEHILIFAGDRCQFFHESFFDYAFARRFAARNGKLLDLLLNDQQDLFRRAQVRQVLAYLRVHNRNRYFDELRNVQSNSNIRFHIKSFVLQWMSSLADPLPSEWKILQDASSQDVELRSHVFSAVGNRESWFDLLLKERFFDAALSGKDGGMQEAAVWLLSLPKVLETRSENVALLLERCRQPTDNWNLYLRSIFRRGAVFHSRRMFDLFLSLIDDGTLDNVRPGFAVNDDWWTVLYPMSESHPDLIGEAIGHWLDRKVKLWDQARQSDCRGDTGPRALLGFESRTHHDLVLQRAIAAPLSFSSQLLPRVERIVALTSKQVVGGLDRDALWSVRASGPNQFRVENAILEVLAICLEEVARTSPADLDAMLNPLETAHSDTLSFLILRAWTAAPAIYASRIANYLASDSRRLQVGYQIGSGSIENYVSVSATRASSAICGVMEYRTLEETILKFRNDSEDKHLRARGWTQFQLLRAMDASRLSAAASSKLRELERKFPDYHEEAPAGITAGAVGSPIPQNAYSKMSDENWLQAMRKYAKVGFRRDQKLPLAGGSDQLANITLASLAKADPTRFSMLAEKMADDLPTSYFDALLRGVAESLNPETTLVSSATTHASALMRRVHALPGRPCGKSICWLIQRGSIFDWPDDVLDAVAWYATNDPDPQVKSTEERIAVQDLVEKDNEPEVHHQGINSTRGAAAEAIGRLLFDHPALTGRFQDAIDSLVHDRSLSVRSCAVLPLVAMLNVDYRRAIDFFKECVGIDTVLLSTPHVPQFIRYAGYRDLKAVWPVIESMLNSPDQKVVSAAALEVVLFSLDQGDCISQRDKIENGSAEMRRAAAKVYAANISHERVGVVCRDRIRRFFSDTEDVVKAEAALAFQHIAELSMDDQADLLTAFLNAGPRTPEMEPVLRAFEQSQAQLPDLVFRLAEVCVATIKGSAADLSKSEALVAMDLSKIVVRLYAQTENSKTRSRCLDLIDDMERYRFMGLSDELRKVGR